MLRRDKAEHAVRELLSTHVAERRIFDNIHQYMVPWDSATATARVGATVHSIPDGRATRLPREYDVNSPSHHQRPSDAGDQT